MVDFNTFMSIGLEKCGSPDMSQEQNQALFGDLVDVWNDEKEIIQGMSESAVRTSLSCP
jgi:hypothetical protein